jgi:transglutaminase-like putative cysteine protease
VLLALAGTAPAALLAQKPGTPVRCQFDFEVVPAAATTKADLTALIPRTIDGRQRVEKIVYAPEPSRMVEDQGNTYAVFDLPAKTPTFAVSITADLLLSPPADQPLREQKPKKDAFAPWLVTEKWLDVDAPEIRAAAKSLKATGDEDLARGVAKLVMKHLTYSRYEVEPKGALAAWQSAQGDCTEFSDLMVSLCRARGLPARHCSGYTTEWAVVPCHCWVEVFCKGKGWILFDPTLGKVAAEQLNGNKPIYVHLSSVRNDPHLLGHQLYSYSFLGEAVKVTAKFAATVDGKTKSWQPQ